jgi:hypothetical protein
MINTIEKSTDRLLPRGQGWAGVNSGVMKQLSDGLSGQIYRDKVSANNIIRDYYPYETTFLDIWETILVLPKMTTLSDSARRKRIESVRAKIAYNTFSGMAEFLNLSGFSVRCIPLQEFQDPTILTNVLEVIGDGRYSGLNKTFAIPVDSAKWPMLFIVENDDGSIIELTPDLLTSIRFLILKAKPPFMWCLLRGVLI